MEITNLSALHDFLAGMPEGTTADIIASDLEADNFETANFVKPDGSGLEVCYSGEVAEGYVSPSSNFIQVDTTSRIYAYYGRMYPSVWNGEKYAFFPLPAEEPDEIDWYINFASVDEAKEYLLEEKQ